MQGVQKQTGRAGWCACCRQLPAHRTPCSGFLPTRQKTIGTSHTYVQNWLLPLRNATGDLMATGRHTADRTAALLATAVLLLLSLLLLGLLSLLLRQGAAKGTARAGRRRLRRIRRRLRVLLHRVIHLMLRLRLRLHLSAVLARLLLLLLQRPAKGAHGATRRRA